MKFIYNNKEYEVEIIKKNNKYTYIRIKNNKIIITTNYFTTNRYIKKILQENYNNIGKALIKEEKKQINSNEIKLLGKIYNLSYSETITSPTKENNQITIKDDKMLNKWLNQLIKNIFTTHLDTCFNMFEENIPYPTLKLRTMKSRWGVCNTKTHAITLNKELIKYKIECLDYVCIHELSHLIEANHSKNFWNIVAKYCPNYKEIRKELRN